MTSWAYYALEASYAVLAAVFLSLSVYQIKTEDTKVIPLKRYVHRLVLSASVLQAVHSIDLHGIHGIFTPQAIMAIGRSKAYLLW